MTPHTTQATLVALESLSPDIYRIILKPKHYIPYDAGQYLKVKILDSWVPYSIANAPHNSKNYELHIKHTASSKTTQILFDLLKSTNEITLSLPYGHCALSQFPPHRPILFIAGGTGFAPIHAMIEALLSQKDAPLFELYWGVKQKEDLYLTPNNSFYFQTSIANAQDPLLIDLIEAQHRNDLNNYTIVISGPFDMAYDLRDRLIKEGINIEHLYSDAFEYEEK